MKPIKITEKNNADLEAALTEVNGRATAHTATVADLRSLARDAEIELGAFDLPMKHRPGARVTWQSGDKLPNAYSKHGRKVKRTSVRLERRATGWFLVDLTCSEDWATQAPSRMALTLTAEQDEIAVAKLRARYKLAA